MSLVDQSATTTADGKSTGHSEQLSAGEATRMLMLPQLPYADAVYAALVEASLTPGVLEAGLRRGRTGASELYMRAVWPAGSPGLGDRVRRHGLSLAWSHVTGWSAHDVAVDLLLDLDLLAAPNLVADAALHLVAEPLDGAPPPGADGRWSEAVYLDIALARYEELPTW